MSKMRERTGDFIRQLKGRIGAMLLQRASRKQPGLFDRACARVLAWVTDSPKPAQPDHFMRDDLIDADIEFDPVELAKYQQPPDQQVVSK